VFLGLSETAFSDSYVIGEFTHLLERVWYSPFMLERKAVILDLCLRTLIKNRNAWKVINDLRSELDAIFYLAPIQQDEVSRQVDLWIRMHLR
jgi:hypothetical protein